MWPIVVLQLLLLRQLAWWWVPRHRLGGGAIWWTINPKTVVQSADKRTDYTVQLQSIYLFRSFWLKNTTKFLQNAGAHNPSILYYVSSSSHKKEIIMNAYEQKISFRNWKRKWKCYSGEICILKTPKHTQHFWYYTWSNGEGDNVASRSWYVLVLDNICLYSLILQMLHCKNKLLYNNIHNLGTKVWLIQVMYLNLDADRFMCVDWSTAVGPFGSSSDSSQLASALRSQPSAAPLGAGISRWKRRLFGVSVTSRPVNSASCHRFYLKPFW